jgi:signal transduction histidine kinase/CheY-like chemotaxis protein
MSARRHHYCLRHCWLMLAGWLLIVLQAHATTLAVDQQTPYQSLVPWLQQCLTTATVDSPATLDTKSCRHGRFTAVNPQGLSLGFTDETLWLRLTLHNRESSTTLTYLEVGYPPLDDIRLFWKQDGQWHSDRNGDSVPLHARSLKTRIPAFLLQLQPDETRELLLRVRSTSAIAMPVSVASPTVWIQKHERLNIALGIFYGISITAMFMAAIFYVLLRETVFLNFLLFIGSVTGVMLHLDGLGALIWHSIPLWQQYGIIHLEVLAGISSILFIQRFLSAAATPAFFRVFYRSTIAWLLICMCMALVIPYALYAQLVAIACLILIPSMFVHGLSLAVRGDRPAIIFTAGWSGFFAVGMLIFLNNLGYAHQMDVSIEYFRIGLEIVMLGLFFSLGWRIYEMKEERRSVEAAASTALELSRTRSEFLARMSHELRTPMNGVLGIAELLRDTQMTPMQRSYINTLQDSGRHLLDVINDILDFSKLSAGKVKLRQEAFCLRDLAEDIHSIFALQAETRGLSYAVTTRNVETPVLGDPTWLRQVLINLIGNAFKFTEKGGIAVAIRMESVSRARQRILVDVTDTGRGIPPAEAQKLFQPFSQLDTPSHQSRDGTGLGLAICRQLMDLMGGEIGVDSTPEQGSRFWLSLILPEAGEASLLTPPAERDDTTAIALTGLCALVAEDNPTNLMILEKILKKFGMTITAARNGEEAVQLFCTPQRHFDIVLMDCEMPVMSGVEATRRIRDHEAVTGQAPVPIIALTAHTAPEMVEEFLEAGMSDHLGKPFRQDMLRHMIQRYLERH